VNCVTTEEFLAEEIIVKEFEFQISDEAWHKVKKFAMDNMGKPYGICSVFGYAYMIIMGWCGVEVNNPFPEQGAWVCSEFACALLYDMIENRVPVTVADVTPKKMMSFVEKLPKNLTEVTPEISDALTLTAHKPPQA
jgi:hypothetical protein